jgi:hypothetical protein
MITEHQEVARYRVAEQLRAAEARAQRHEARRTERSTERSTGQKQTGPRHGLAAVLRRLADRLEPIAAPRVTEPVARHRATGLSVVR